MGSLHSSSRSGSEITSISTISYKSNELNRKYGSAHSFICMCLLNYAEDYRKRDTDNQLDASSAPESRATFVHEQPCQHYQQQADRKDIGQICPGSVRIVVQPGHPAEYRAPFEFLIHASTGVHVYSQ